MSDPGLDEAMAWIELLACEIGPRRPTGPAEREAAERTAALLADRGVDARLESFHGYASFGYPFGLIMGAAVAPILLSPARRMEVPAPALGMTKRPLRAPRCRPGHTRAARATFTTTAAAGGQACGRPDRQARPPGRGAAPHRRSGGTSGRLAAVDGSHAHVRSNPQADIDAGPLGSPLVAWIGRKQPVRFPGRHLGKRPSGG